MSAVSRRNFIVGGVRQVRPVHTLSAAEALRTTHLKVMVVDALDDTLFKRSNAERLANDVPGAQLEVITASKCFVQLDQAQALACLIKRMAS